MQPSSECARKGSEESDTNPGCQPPFSLTQDDFPLLGDTVDTTSRCDSSVSSNDDLQSIWSVILTDLNVDPGLFFSKPAPGRRTEKLTPVPLGSLVTPKQSRKFSKLPDVETLVPKLADDTADDSQVRLSLKQDTPTQTDSKDAELFASTSNETLASVACRS